MSDQTGPAVRSDELKRALIAIRDLRRKVQDLEGRAREPIAIVGMSCRFPGGADTPERYWDLLRTATDATCDVPSDRWDIESLYDPDPDAPGRIYTRRGGFLREPVDQFDAGFFGISPKEAEAMDPVQRLLLELSWEALERAGIAPLSLNGTDTGVFIGVSGSDYDTLQHQSASLEAIHPYRGTGTAACVAGGRISHVLGLQGPNIAVDTACSSSLSALVLAVENLRAGRCRMALAGGAHLMLAPESTVYLCRMRALSPGGRCRTFDAEADGYARGEGGGMFVLKRLGEARADGDRVLAVIRGVAINHDGHSSGLTVPNPVAQRAVINAAVRDGALDPLDVDYIEAHGTATPLGDPIEVRAAAEVLCRNRPADRPLLIGSVKTNFGHLEAASGVAGLMKLVLALQHREIPPHLHCARPTPHIDWERMAVRVTTTATPWQPEGKTPIGGVSAFGFSGTNAHVIVAAAPEAAVEEVCHPAELVVLSARSRDAVRALAGRYADRLRDADAARFAEVAVTSLAGRSPLPFRAAVVGDSAGEAVAALDELATGSGEIDQVRGAAAGHCAFLFTGQGSQYPGMAQELYRVSATARDALERCDEILRPHLDRPLLELLLREEDASVLQQTVYAQPTLFAVEYALAALWRGWGVAPAFVAGHSLGEYVAATVAGVMSLEDALPLVALRGRLMQALPGGGAMAAVFAPESTVRSALEDAPAVSIAALNGPENTVVSGPAAALSKVVRRLEADGVQSKSLHVSHAFHSALVEPVLDPFQEAVSAIALAAPRIPLVSNLTGKLLTEEEAVDPVRWRRHLREPVRFSPSLAELHRLGVRYFLEVGPHPALAAMGAATVPDADVHWLPSMRRGRSTWRELLDTAGRLWRYGLALDTQAFAREHGARRTVAPTYPFERSRYWYSDAPEWQARPVSAPGAVPGADAAGAHPLLGDPVRSPAIEGWVFQVTLHPDRPRYLRDHQVRGAVIVPAAAFIETMAAGVQAALGTDAAGLEQVTIETPLVLTEDAGTLCQVVIGTPLEGRLPVRLVSEGPDGRWVTHARAEARVGDGEAPVPAAVDPGSLQAGATRQVAAEELYERLHRRGIAYGPAFRGLEAVWASDSTALGRVRLPAEAAGGASDDYGIHPCLMDLAFQLLEGLSGEFDPEQVYLPVGVERVRRYDVVPASGWVLAQRREPDDDADELVADLALLSESGAVLAELKGFRARRVRGSIAARSPNALVYETGWEPVDLPVLEDATLAGRWLVLGNGGPVEAEVLGAMAARGARLLRVRQGDRTGVSVPGEPIDGEPIVVDAGDEASWSALERAVESGEPVTGVLHCGSLGAGAGRAIDGAGRLERLLDRASVLPALLRLEAVRNAPRGVRILTQGAVAHAAGGCAGGEDGAALWGLLRVLQAEHPEIECRAVDADPAAGGGNVDRLVAALFGRTDEDRLVMRDGAPFAPRLRAVPDDPERALARSPSVGELELPGGDYAIEITRRGAVDAVRYRSAEPRAPGPGEVEVRVRTTGLNFRDVLNVLGMYPGASGPPGVEFAGVVARVGDGVTRFRVGDEVLGIGEGAFASQVTGPEAALAHLPRTLSATEAATIPLAFLTAEWGLAELAQLAPGERVLIHAAAGGVGQAAVQIALARGAQVFATAGSEQKRAWLRTQGVQQVFDSRSDSFAEGVRSATGGEGVDVVLNSLTGELLQRSLELLRPGGRFVEIGKAEILDPAEVEARFEGIRYLWFDLGAILLEEPETFRALFERVLDRFERGELAPLPTRTYPAEQVVDAFRFMAQARHIGKVVVSARPSWNVSRELIRKEGTYLVTGGAGAVGREVAAWLVRGGAGAVLLNGRSAPTPEVRAWMDELARSGTSRVEWLEGDVADPGMAERVVAAAAGEEGALHGIFHAAGVLDDGLLLDQTRERFRGVLAPKVAGAWNLHTLTRSLELDHFVLFSSVASLLGGPGQGSYAAANAFLDALAETRSREGLPALSVQWGAWSGAGMTARLDERQRKAMEAQGVRLLAADRAVEVLERLLASRRTVALVADVDWTRLTAGARQAPPLLRALVHSPAAPTADAVAGPGKVPCLDGLAELDGDARLAALTSYLCTTLAAVLGIRGRPLDEDAEIPNLGFDSLMAVQLRNRIETELGTLLPMKDMLQATTPADIAEVLNLRLAATSPAAATAVAMEPVWTEGEI